MCFIHHEDGCYASQIFKRMCDHSEFVCGLRPNSGDSCVEYPNIDGQHTFIYKTSGQACLIPNQHSLTEKKRTYYFHNLPLRRYLKRNIKTAHKKKKSSDPISRPGQRRTFAYSGMQLHHLNTKNTSAHQQVFLICRG